MSAKLTSYVQDCRDGVGGLKVVRLIPFANVRSITEVGGVIVDIQTDGSFFEFQLAKNASGYSATPSFDRRTGLYHVTETINLSFNKVKKSTSDLIQTLFKNTLIGIVEDRNGNAFLLGRTTGLKAESGDINSGTTAADKSGYTVTLSGQERKISHVDASFMSNFYPALYSRIFENTFAIQFE